MDLQTLVKELENSPKANRQLDEEIAILAGYKRVIEEVKNPDGSKSQRTLWVAPGSPKAVPLPGFTNSIDIARQFVEVIMPNAIAACSWEPGLGNARIKDGPYCQAASPSLALCIAGVRFKIDQLNKR